MFRKILPGAEAGLHTNLKEDPGAPGIIDQQLKVIASQQIRDCMKPYIDKLVELILGQVPGPSTITSAEAKSALDLGDCPGDGDKVFMNDDTKLETFLCSCPAHVDKSAKIEPLQYRQQYLWKCSSYWGGKVRNRLANTAALGSFAACF